MGLFGPSGAEAARLEEEKKTRMEKIRQIKAQMQDDDGFIVETKTSFFGLIKTVTRTPKPTLEDRLTEASPPPPPLCRSLAPATPDHIHPTPRPPFFPSSNPDPHYLSIIPLAFSF
jgi:hypothetical protein